MTLLKNRFKKQLFEYLNKVVIRHPSYGLLYPLFESADTEDFLIGMQVTITFRLKPERPSSWVSLEELEAKPPEKEERVDEGWLPSVAEQVFWYTFLSIGGINKNKRDFEQFVMQEYLSPEQIKANDDAWWEKIQDTGCSTDEK